MQLKTRGGSPRRVPHGPVEQAVFMSDDRCLRRAEGPSQGPFHHSVHSRKHPAHCLRQRPRGASHEWAQDSQHQRRGDSSAFATMLCIPTVECSLESMGQGEQTLRCPDCNLVKSDVAEKSWNVTKIPQRLVD